MGTHLMPVIDGNRRVEINDTIGVKPRRSGGGCVTVELDLRPTGGKRISAKLSSKKKALIVMEDLAVVQNHFGANRSEALRIALHLAAQAIRANKAHVTV
jgi:hypothetical protein